MSTIRQWWVEFCCWIEVRTKTQSEMKSYHLDGEIGVLIRKINNNNDSLTLLDAYMYLEPV